jgi:hypothetical protein
MDENAFRSAHSQDVYKENWRAFRWHVLAVLGDADEFVKFSAPRTRFWDGFTAP